MAKHFLPRSLLSYVVIILLLTAIAIRQGASFDWLFPQKDFSYTIADFKQIFPATADFVKNSDGSLSVRDDKQAVLGYVLASDDYEIHAHGYAGKVPLLVALNLQKEIVAIHLLTNNESPEFIEHLQKKHLFDNWNGQMADSTLLSKKVDAVSGATFSSKAIIGNVKGTLAAYLEINQSKLSINWLAITRMVLTAVLLLLSCLMTIKNKFKGWYWYVQLGVLVVFGFWFHQMLSLSLLNGWLIRGFAFQNNKEMIAILLVAIGLSVMGHRNYYCNYLCPMGALQRLVAKVSPFKKRNLRLRISVLDLRTLYFSFIWSALLLGFSLPVSTMEPFMSFSFSVASTLMLIAGGLILVLSLFFNRPWCQVCPTGCFLNTVPSIKTNKTDEK